MYSNCLITGHNPMWLAYTFQPVCTSFEYTMMMMMMMRRFVERVLNSPQTCCQSQSNRWVFRCQANVVIYWLVGCQGYVQSSNEEMSQLAAELFAVVCVECRDASVDSVAVINNLSTDTHSKVGIISPVTGLFQYTLQFCHSGSLEGGEMCYCR